MAIIQAYEKLWPLFQMFRTSPCPSRANTSGASTLLWYVARSQTYLFCSVFCLSPSPLTALTCFFAHLTYIRYGRACDNSILAGLTHVQIKPAVIDNGMPPRAGFMRALSFESKLCSSNKALRSHFGVMNRRCLCYKLKLFQLLCHISET